MGYRPQFQCFVFTVPPDHTIVVIYERQHEIIGVLLQRISSQWRLFCLPGRSDGGDSDPITSANWSQLSLEIKSIILKESGQSLDPHYLPGGDSLS